MSLPLSSSGKRCMGGSPPPLPVREPGRASATCRRVLRKNKIQESYYQITHLLMLKLIKMIKYQSYSDSHE